MGNRIEFIYFGPKTDLEDLRLAISMAQAKSLDFNGDTKLLAFNRSPLKSDDGGILRSRLVLIHLNS